VLAFILSPLGRKLAAAIAVIALLIAAYFYIYNKGHEAGRVAGAREQLEQDRQQFESDRQEFLATLQKYQERDDAAKAVIQAKDSELLALRARRTEAKAAVDRLSDVQVASEVSASDQRELLRIAADYPLVLKQNDELGGKIAALEQRVAAIEGQRDAAVAAYDKLVPLYTKAYNAAQTHHSLFVKIISLGFVRDRKLDLPSPVSLQQ
jgi:chromosome segregation ATPase